MISLLKHPTPRFTSPFLHIPEKGEKEGGEITGRVTEWERIKSVWGRVKDVSSLTHQAEVCSLAHYKTPVKGGKGQGTGTSSERGSGGRGGKGALGQIKTRRKTKTLREGDECGLQGEGRVRVVSKRDFGFGGLEGCTL